MGIEELVMELEGLGFHVDDMVTDHLVYYKHMGGEGDRFRHTIRIFISDGEIYIDRFFLRGKETIPYSIVEENHNNLHTGFKEMFEALLKRLSQFDLKVWNGDYGWHSTKALTSRGKLGGKSNE